MLGFVHWKSLFRRRRFESELAEEFSFHLEERKQELILAGLPPAEAARQARLQFGANQTYGEQCRESYRLHWLDELTRNVRHALRSIRRAPGFAAAAVISLALGIGMNSVVFTVANSLLLKPLPVEDPSRVYFLETIRGGSRQSFPDYRVFRDSTRAFDGLAGYRITPMNVAAAQSPERLWGYLVTGNYFDVLGVKPAIGRLLHASDDLNVGASPYAVLSYNSWRVRFGFDPAIVGKTVHINNRTYTILGVAPRQFHGTELFYWPEVWVPMSMQPQIEAGNPWLDNRFTWNTAIFGRLKPGVTAAMATDDLNRIANDLSRRFPDSDQGLQMRLTKLGLSGSDLRRPIQGFLRGLSLLVGLVLLTACLNLSVLMLARASDRQKEMAIRTSIGATTKRIISQVTTESILLGMIGGVFAMALNAAVCRLLSLWHAPIDFPVQFEISPDWRVLLFTAVLSVITGIVFGILPALKLAKADLNCLIKGAAALLKPRFGFSFRDLLVVAEVALCFVLLFGALLSIRSLKTFLQLPLGFDPVNLTTAAIDVSLPEYNEAAAKLFQKRLLQRTLAIPGVKTAAYANALPLGVDQSTTGVHAESDLAQKGRKAQSANYFQISPNFLNTLRIPLINGRDFTIHDTGKTQRVAIVNRAFARQVMHTGNSVGRVFRQGPGEGPRVLVVGMVGDGRYVTLADSNQPVVFWPIDQMFNSTTTLFVRSSRSSSEIVHDLRQVIAEMNPRLPVYGTGSLESTLGFALFPMHAAAIALSAFGLLAFVLALTGINGLVSYSVSRQWREIGIRRAIGAQPLAILRFVLAKVVVLLIVGLLVGLVLALATGHALNALLFGVSPQDPIIFATVLIALFSSTLASCAKPVIRALRVDPMSALRYE
jgi:predicted permease